MIVSGLILVSVSAYLLAKAQAAANRPVPVPVKK